MRGIVNSRIWVNQTVGCKERPVLITELLQ